MIQPYWVLGEEENAWKAGESMREAGAEREYDQPADSIIISGDAKCAPVGSYSHRPNVTPMHSERCPVSYNDHDSTMLSQLTAVIASNPSVVDRQIACEVLSKLSWIRRSLTPAAAALLDAMVATAASARQANATGKWIDKIDRHSHDRPFPPSIHRGKSL